MSGFCQEHDIIREVIALYTPHSNSVAERKNRTLMDMVNCMLLGSGAPENLWGETLLLPVSFSKEFFKDTLTLLFMNVKKGELLISNSSKSEVA